jgi:hypothetical protein
VVSLCGQWTLKQNADHTDATATRIYTDTVAKRRKEPNSSGSG